MFIVVMVYVCCSPIIEVFILFVISFQPPFVWIFIIATSLSGFFLDSFSHVQSVFLSFKESGLSTGVGQTAKMWLSEKCYY